MVAIIYKPPFGPYDSSSITFCRSTSSVISTAQGYGKMSFAGSKLTMIVFLHTNQSTNQSNHYPNLFVPSKNCCIPLQYVDLPDPGGPTTNCPNGMVNCKMMMRISLRTFFLGPHIFVMSEEGSTVSLGIFLALRSELPSVADVPVSTTT